MERRPRATSGSVTATSSSGGSSDGTPAAIGATKPAGHRRAQRPANRGGGEQRGERGGDPPSAGWASDRGRCRGGRGGRDGGHRRDARRAADPAEAKRRRARTGRAGICTRRASGVPATAERPRPRARFGAEAGRVGRSKTGRRPTAAPAASSATHPGGGRGRGRRGLETEGGVEGEGSGGAEGSDEVGRQFRVQEAAAGAASRARSSRSRGEPQRREPWQRAQEAIEEMAMRPESESSPLPHPVARLARRSATAADPAVFETPEAATEAVVGALEARDRAGLIEMFRSRESGRRPLRRCADDREAWGEFLRDYRALRPARPRGRRPGDAGDRARPLAVPRAAGPRRCRLALRRRGGARGACCCGASARTSST